MKCACGRIGPDNCCNRKHPYPFRAAALVALENQEEKRRHDKRYQVRPDEKPAVGREQRGERKPQRDNAYAPFAGRCYHTKEKRQHDQNGQYGFPGTAGGNRYTLSACKYVPSQVVSRSLSVSA